LPKAGIAVAIFAAIARIVVTVARIVIAVTIAATIVAVAPVVIAARVIVVVAGSRSPIGIIIVAVVVTTSVARVVITVTVAAVVIVVVTVVIAARVAVVITITSVAIIRVRLAWARRATVRVITAGRGNVNFVGDTRLTLLAGGPASYTAGRVVGEAFLGVKILLPDGKNKLFATIFTGDNFVLFITLDDITLETHA